MENNNFDRSDFEEILDYLGHLRKGVEKVQGKTDTFCNSFNSGLEEVRQNLAKVNLTGLSDGISKIQTHALKLNKWVSKTGNQINTIGVANAENTISFMASTAEMTYGVLSTVASLGKLQELKITTNAEENKKALEGVVGTGERMKELFDELQANPLLKNLGIEKDVFAKFRSRWEVLQARKEDVAGLMTTYGQGKENVGEFRENWRAIRDNKDHSLKGFGAAVKAIFKKKEKQPEEENEKKGFFSIFRKKEEGDKNWFTAVAHRFNDFKDQIRAGIIERFTPMADYATRVSAAYSPLYHMAGNSLKVMKLGKDFKEQSQMTWLKAADGWGIGNRVQNQEAMMKLKVSGEKRNGRLLEREEKIEDWSEKIMGTFGKVNTLIGKNPAASPILDSHILQEGLAAPELMGLAPVFPDRSTNPVSVHVDRLVENLTITPANLTEGIEKMKEMMMDELQRILNNVNNWTCETNLN